jgi:glutathione S-transferase
MAMKLYYAPGACSLAPMILAEWLGLPMDLERGDHRNPDAAYLAKNPLGAVPALELESGRVFTQVDAILQYFCAVRPGSGLDAGGDPLDQFEVHRWVAFLTGDFHPPFGGWFNPRRFTTDHSEPALAAVKEALARRIAQVARPLESQLGEEVHIALGRRTFLDAYAYAMVRWMRKLAGGLQPYPNLARFMAAMDDDPGVRRALRRESA